MDYRERSETYKAAIIVIANCGCMAEEQMFNALRVLYSDYESAVSSAEYAEKRKEGLTIVNQSDLP